MRMTTPLLALCMLLLVMQAALSLDIFEAASEGDLATVKTLINKNPKLAFTRGSAVSK